jgi:hypothetical protein
MKKSDFLAQLRGSVTSAADEILGGSISSAGASLYINQQFNYYSAQSGQQIEQAIRKDAPEAAGAQAASSYIIFVTARVRSEMTKLAATGESSGTSLGLPGGVMGAVGSVASGIASAASSVVEDAGQALSSLGSILFKEREGGADEGGNPQQVQSQLSGGQSLNDGVRSRMESAFGESFSDVEVHTDGSAAQLSADLKARAFTVGTHIAFGSGEYQPGNPVGDALIAHELAHVVQQRGGGFATQRRERQAPESSALEVDADDAAVSAVVSSWGSRKAGLARVSRNAMPKLKSGLKLQRCAGKKPAPEPIPADPHAVYEQKLKEAVAMLKGVSFGRAENPPRKFDTDYWLLQRDTQYTLKLVLKLGKRPSDAIDAMFNNLGDWKVDCAQFIQVAEWYALRQAFGADEFNRKVGGLSFELRPHMSTGINTKEQYNRSGPGVQMRRSSDGAVEPKTVEQIITDAPIGSRVMWTNLKAPTSSAFRNENTIKVGPDLYAAHGFGGDRNTFSRAEIEEKLAKVENPTADAAYITANVFVAQIEYYDTP